MTTWYERKAEGGYGRTTSGSITDPCGHLSATGVDQTPLDNELHWWHIRGMMGARTTWAPGQMFKEGRFTNPARMCEDLGAKDANGSLGEFFGRIWTHVGWWDKS